MAVDWSGYVSPLERQKIEAARILGRREQSRRDVDEFLADLNRKAMVQSRRASFEVIEGGKRAAPGSLSRSDL